MLDGPFHPKLLSRLSAKRLTGYEQASGVQNSYGARLAARRVLRGPDAGRARDASKFDVS